MSNQGDSLMRSQRLYKKRHKGTKVALLPLPDPDTAKLAMANIAAGRTRPIQEVVNTLWSKKREGSA